MLDNGDPLWSAGMRRVRELSKPREVQRGFKVFEVISQASKVYHGLQRHIADFRGICRVWRHIIECPLTVSYLDSSKTLDNPTGMQ